MSNMLTKDDLQAIGDVVAEKVRPLDEKIESLEARMDVKFDAVQERFDEIKNMMLTRHDLEHYEVGFTERLDKRYVRKVL